MDQADVGRWLDRKRKAEAACAAVIAYLADLGKKATFREIADRFPDCEPTVVFPQLRDVEGVLFITAEPAGLALNDRLRKELSAFGEGDARFNDGRRR